MFSNVIPLKGRIYSEVLWDISECRLNKLSLSREYGLVVGTELSSFPGCVTALIRDDERNG